MSSTSEDKRRPADKIFTLDQLALISQQLRERGESIVLCHGVFDLLHLGHVRYLEAARRQGSVLIVSLTEDRFVNKGPDRPAFSGPMRAEMLASLLCVDYVTINPAPTAVPVIQALRPHVYAKGMEYANASNDLTGKIVDEISAVEAGGGRPVFIDEVVFSSSKLLNRYGGMLDQDVRDYLNDLRQRHSINDVFDAIRSIENKRVVLVGDAILDEYQYVNPQGRAAKENIIVTRYVEKDLFAGGVVAAANHLASFCREVEVVTVLGQDDPFEDVIRAAIKPNVILSPIYRPKAPTTRKVRFVEKAYSRKLFEVYHIEDAPCSGGVLEEVVQTIERACADADVTIVTDFGHGMLEKPVIAALQRAASFMAVNAQTNSGNYGFNLITKYARADFICIDGPEAKLAVGDKFAPIHEIASRLLPGMIDCKKIILTQGRDGCTVFDQGDELRQIPAFTRNVVDTVGAGDAFLAIASPLVQAGVPIELAGIIGNAAGALKVGILGHRSAVEKVALQKYLDTLLK